MDVRNLLKPTQDSRNLTQVYGIIVNIVQI